ncbi:MAG: circularly permuted type 2 ATP-grasp protein [Limnobacter sp.]|nr:circularly permuted type 2 ATP-grasp protein [Limnobacter sp.]
MQGTNEYYSELAANGKLRPVWKNFFDRLPEPGGVKLLHNKRAALQRLIRENGVTYNVYADTEQGASRPWQLDLLPMIIEEDDWATLSQAASQRARLLNTMMADIYGEQRVLNEGILPPDIVFGHGGYLPQMQGVQPIGGVWLHQVAFDFGRSPDGRWWLISHRVQAPSGLGYALENRVSISRSFKRAFRDMGVQQLGRFFKDYIEAIYSLCPKGENSRVALLTPGPYNETYFEHTYLARYLGISLVEASDLVVRQNKVYLKTVKGLERIDALIRRTDDQWLDPLELREDSALGVAGLMHAIRNQGVIMVNMPGGGWLEGPALHGFMPLLSQTFLNEELVVPSVPSWWCGERPAWRDASSRLKNLVIRSTYPNDRGHNMEPVMGSTLEPSECNNWMARISRNPSQYTLQELIPLSRAPIWGDKGLEEKSVMLRVYAVTDGKGGYTVMPGGLTRVAGHLSGVVSMQRGGSSMDTWVRHSGPLDTTTNLKDRLQAEDLISLRQPVSSRAAEYLFWLGRYTERAAFSLRLLNKTISMLNDDDQIDPTSLDFVQELCATQGLIVDYDPEKPLHQDEFETALYSHLWQSNSGEKPSNVGLASTLSALSGMAFQLRNRLSTGHWRLLTDIGKLLDPSIARPYQVGNTEKTLEEVRLYLMALYGEQSDHMTRDVGWRFLQLGRQIERLASATDSLIALTNMPGRANDQGLALCIALADSVITYRSRYQHRFEWLPAMDLLIFDEDLPYSLRRILYKLDIVLDRLPGDRSAARALFEGAYRSGSLPNGLSLKALQPPFPPATIKHLREWLTTLNKTAGLMSDTVGAQYFRLAELPDQMIQER